jgi:hypothetical protein
MDKEIYEKIVKKKEFSNLPKKDVEKVWGLFEKRETSDEDKIKLTRDMLRKVYFAFGSEKLLNPKIVDKKSVEEILKKHISTLERFDFYEELYAKLLKDSENSDTQSDGALCGEDSLDCESSGEISVIDLGAGINGLSYNYFKRDLNYLGIEAVGQLNDLVNYYFKNRGIESSHAIHESLFEVEKIKHLLVYPKLRSKGAKMIKQLPGKRIVFLFKTLDSLEMLERNYSKKFLEEIFPFVDKVVVSFATRSLISKKSFKVKRYWFENFVKEKGWKSEVFELGCEKYFVLEK